MKTLEKQMLILEPLLGELAPLGYFRKGKQLWHINRQEGYAILIETEMYMRGTYKQVLVQYGSFWKDISASSQGSISLCSMITLDDSCIPFPSFGIKNAQELERLVRDSAPYMVSQLKQKVLPILRTIHDLSSFVKASAALDALQQPGGWPTHHRVWDYLALGDRNVAHNYLQDLIKRTWREDLEKHITTRSPAEQKEIHRWNEERATLMDRIERKNREQLQAVLHDLEALTDDALAALMQARFSKSEATLAAYIGPRRWNQL